MKRSAGNVSTRSRASHSPAISPFTKLLWLKQNEPDVANHIVYTRLYDDVYRHLYPALQAYLKRLTELTKGTV